MHRGQEGAESKNILPQTREVRLQGANVASNEVIHGVIHSGDGWPWLQGGQS